MPEPSDRAAVFDRVFGTHLRQYRIEEHDPHSLEVQLIARVLANARHQIDAHRALGTVGMPHVHFFLIDNPRLNARAGFDLDTGTGCIGIYTGAILLLFDAFARMMSHPHIKVDVGRASDEATREPYHSEGFFLNHEELIASRGSAAGRLLDVLPVDPIRRRYAFVLGGSALSFLVQHELAHIRHGHIHFLRNAGAHLVSELVLDARASGLSSDQCITLQALEFDADAYASMTSHPWLSPTVSTELRCADRELTLGGRFPHADWHQPVFMADWFFAIPSMFWLFGLNFDLSRLDANAHPPGPQRALNVAGTIMTHLVANRASERIRDYVGRASSLGLGESGDAVRLLSGGGAVSPTVHMINAWRSGAFDRHVDRLKQRWTQIRGDLARYSYSALAP